MNTRCDRQQLVEILIMKVEKEGATLRFPFQHGIARF